ncbi:MAG: nitrite reductase large subunit, partial [Mycobacterium sp.]|nr:nitrite reductase large subunit [Mycobacterium sp.]
MTTIEIKPERNGQSATGSATLVVVGNGMAGVRAIEEILTRGGGEKFSVTVFGDEPYGNYNRIMLSNVLAGSDDTAEIFLNPVDWYSDNDIDLRAGVRVVRIDRFAHRVYADDGSIIRYDKLILATGSRSFFPPMEGMWRDDKSLTPGVFGFRSLDDCQTMIDFARGRTRAVVIGGGLLGLEAARGLQNRGLEVDVVHSPTTLMNAQLDDNGGTILRRSVQGLGIGVHTGKRTTKVLQIDGALAGVEFSDGETLPCDMLVVAAGIRSNVGLAQRAGLTVERAVVVDDHMRSVDDDDIYAVGECVQHRGQVYGLVAPLWEQAAVLADHITGVNPVAAYHGSRMATKLKVAGVDVASMGLKGPEHEDDEFVQYSEPRRGVYKTVVLRDNKLIGATLVGDVSKVAFLMQAFDRGLPMPDERVSLLFDIGTPEVAVGAAELSDEAQVCNCNGVNKSTIVQTVREGEKSVTGVMAATRAGKGCGSCKGLVAQIVEWAAGGAVEEDPSVGWYVPGIPYPKPELMQLIRELKLHSVSSVFAALAPDGKEDAGSKMALSSLLDMMWADEFVDERDGRFINDRVHANIQRDGISLRGLGFTYPDQASPSLSDLDLDLPAGSIVAIVGENGAGKSTLMKTLYGMHRPDEGTIALDGETVVLHSPADAIARGVGMVHQHFKLADNFTVAENVVLGAEPHRGWALDRREARRRIREIGRKYGLNVDPDALVEDLGVGDRQRVEILKVLYRGARTLILDEPTAVLVPQEVDELFDALRELKREGLSIIFISHKL